MLYRIASAILEAAAVLVFCTSIFVWASLLSGVVGP